MPGKLRRSVYLPPPVVFSAASIMSVGLPIMEKSVIIIPSEARNLSSAGRFWSLGCDSSLLRRNRRLYRRIHLAVARTATQIAAHRRSNISLRRIGILRQQRLHGHDESRRAKTALRAAPIAISFLDRRQTAMLAHALDGRDFLLLATRGQQRAGHHRDTIHQHGTGAAGRLIAAALRASEPQILP